MNDERNVLIYSQSYRVLDPAEPMLPSSNYDIDYFRTAANGVGKIINQYDLEEYENVTVVMESEDMYYDSTMPYPTFKAMFYLRFETKFEAMDFILRKM